MDKNNVTSMYIVLCELYPEESFGSYASVFLRGLKEHVITDEEFDRAKNYYGTLWNYAGD